jgi:hypothetical protein
MPCISSHNAPDCSVTGSSEATDSNRRPRTTRSCVRVLSVQNDAHEQLLSWTGRRGFHRPYRSLRRSQSRHVPLARLSLRGRSLASGNAVALITTAYAIVRRSQFSLLALHLFAKKQWTPRIIPNGFGEKPVLQLLSGGEPRCRAMSRCAAHRVRTAPDRGYQKEARQRYQTAPLRRSFQPAFSTNTRLDPASHQRSECSPFPSFVPPPLGLQIQRRIELKTCWDSHQCRKNFF